MTAPKRSTIKGQALIAPPWEPCETTKPEFHAIQALVHGDATKEQQAVFVGWLKRATAINEMEFRPDSERATTFASGKRFVGQLFFTLAQATPPSK